jgi:hypothetical protein
MSLQSAASTVVGRDAELSVLLRVLEEHGPRVCFVYGIAGIGKSSLLARFGEECERLGIDVVAVDCRSIEPTELGFVGGLASAVDPTMTVTSTGDLAALAGGRRTVVLIDTYEVFRLTDPWLRHELLPALGPDVRVVVAGREPPMLEWAIERGQLGGLEVLPLGRLDDDSVQTIVRSAGVDDGPAATEIARVSRGHPLALRLALEARLAAGEMPETDAMSQVVDALAGAFRAGLDEEARRALDAAAVPRRITRGVLAAMLGDEADDALDILSGLAFVEATSEGLRLHDAVQSAIVERLRALDPERFRRYRAAAWHYLQTETRGVARRELARSTADLLFLIDNPVVREAMFPTSAHAYSVEPARVEDATELRSLWHRYDSPEAAHALDLWLERAPGAMWVMRDRSGAVVGCSICTEWCDIPQSLERDDPVTAAWARHAALHPLPNGQTTLVIRRTLARDTGEGPSGPQAAAWQDCKRHYFRMRPQIGRVYNAIADPTPFADVLAVVGFRPFPEPVFIGDDSYLPAVLDFGPDSVDGWLSRLAAAELGIADRGFLDPGDRTVDLGAERIQLSPLEFGVLATLSERPGRAVTRAELIEQVWGTTYSGGSNVVDVVVRSLRQKLGPIANRVETARGVGYRLK